MSDDEELAKSEMSTVESAFHGAAEAPRGAGAQAAGGGGAAAFADQIAHLPAVSGPDAQEEARVRATRKAHLWATLQEQTAGIPALARIVEELEALDWVSAAIFLSFFHSASTPRSEPFFCFRSRAALQHFRP